MDIIVGAFHARARSALHGQLRAAGLQAALEVDSPAALTSAVAEAREPLLLGGVRWPEIAPFLECAIGCAIPAALLLEERCLDAGHAAFRRGATALLPWPTASAPFAQALETIRHGLRVVPVTGLQQQPDAAVPAAPGALRPRSHLSARERALLELVAAGLGNKAIARTLGLSVNTVKYHLASIFAKLDARTRAEAVSAAARRGELLL